jgi:hypothetical protein
VGLDGAIKRSRVEVGAGSRKEERKGGERRREGRRAGKRIISKEKHGEKAE